MASALLPLRSLVAHGAALDAMLALLPTPALCAVRGRARGQYYAIPNEELFEACEREVERRIAAMRVARAASASAILRLS